MCQFTLHLPDLYNVVDWQIFLQIVVDLRKIAVDWANFCDMEVDWFNFIQVNSAFLRFFITLAYFDMLNDRSIST